MFILLLVVVVVVAVAVLLVNVPVPLLLTSGSLSHITTEACNNKSMVINKLIN